MNADEEKGLAKIDTRLKLRRRPGKKEDFPLLVSRCFFPVPAAVHAFAAVCSAKEGQGTRVQERESERQRPIMCAGGERKRTVEHKRGGINAGCQGNRGT